MTETRVPHPIRRASKALAASLLLSLAFAACGSPAEDPVDAAPNPEPSTAATVSSATQEDAVSLPTTIADAVPIPTTLSSSVELAGVTIEIVEIDPPAASTGTPCIAELVIPNTALGFAQGSASIQDEQLLGELLDDVESLISAGGTLVSVTVEGFASIEGDEERNLELSQSRANALAAEFDQRPAFASVVVTAVGRGETTEFAAGSTEEALAQNRVVRVALELADCR